MAYRSDTGSLIRLASDHLPIIVDLSLPAPALAGVAGAGQEATT